MLADDLLFEHLSVSCPHIHKSRMQAVLDVATGLKKSNNLNLTAIGRELSSDVAIKHRVKKVDRLLSNHHLFNELSSVYSGLSSYIFKYISEAAQAPLILDLCYMKDTHDVQMLSAEIALKGRTLPVYREVFAKNELKSRAVKFIENLSRCIPSDRDILIIMDAGFGEDWFKAISDSGWFWLVRARGKKFIKLADKDDWEDARELYEQATTRVKAFNHAYITKKSPRACRVILKAPAKATKNIGRKKPKNYHQANGNYRRSAQEPWVLVTNLPVTYEPTKVVNQYKKRMQIEESFRDVKSHQFGLSSRYIRSVSVYRWSIAMLLAAIVQVMLWVIGVIGHHQGMQAYFQVNTVKNKKVFSYFYLGQLIVQHNKLDEVMSKCNDIFKDIAVELARDW